MRLLIVILITVASIAWSVAPPAQAQFSRDREIDLRNFNGDTLTWNTDGVFVQSGDTTQTVTFITRKGRSFVAHRLSIEAWGDTVWVRLSNEWSLTGWMRCPPGEPRNFSGLIETMELWRDTTEAAVDSGGALWYIN